MRIIFLPLIAFMLFVFSSCSKSDTPEKIKETVDPSILKAMVLLHDEAGNYINDKSGVTVSLENSSPLVSAVTDSTGKFSLKVDPELKSFTLVYSKPLYGTYKEYYTRNNDSLYWYQKEWRSNIPRTKVLVRDGLLPSSPQLGRKSTITVNSLQASIVNGQLRLTCNISDPTPGNPKYIQVFYQENTPITSFEAIPKNEKSMSSSILVKNNGDNVLDFCLNCCLYEIAGMHSGDTVYMTAYGSTYFSTFDYYLDIPTNKLVMPNLNLSQDVTPISFVLP